MKWLNMAVVLSIILIVCGCGGPEEVQEPTPDIKAKLTSPIELEKWFTELLYSFSLCEQAVEAFDEYVFDSEGKLNREAAKIVVDYYNESGKVADRLNSKLDKIKDWEKQLKDGLGFEKNVYKNMTDMNRILEELVKLVVLIPEDGIQFKEKQQRFRSQFLSLEKLLKPEYPNVDADLASKKAPENPDFRQFSQIIRDVSKLMIPKATPVSPTPVSTTETTEEESSSTTELQPPTTWKDDQGNIHIGQRQVDDSMATEKRSEEVSKATEPEQDSTSSPENEIDESDVKAEDVPLTESYIWTDDKGVTHMGSKPPEGVKAKKADEIPIMMIGSGS